MKHVSAVAKHVAALKRKGVIKAEVGKARSLRVTSPLAKLRNRIVDIPLFGSIPAGLPQNREQDAEGCVTVDMESIGFKPETHAQRFCVAGDRRFNDRKAYLRRRHCVLEHGPEPRNGQIVAALIDGANTLKTFVEETANRT